MNAIILGGAGFIGTELQRELRKKAFEVQILDSYDRRVHGRNPRINSEVMRIDLIKKIGINFWTPLPDAKVFFLVAETSTGASEYELVRQCKVSILTLMRTLEFWDNLNYRPNCIVLASSRAVYGEGYSIDDVGNLRSIKERSVLELSEGSWDNLRDSERFEPNSSAQQPQPISVYGVMKLNQENILKVWCKHRNIPLKIARLQNVIGPGQSIKNPYSGFVTLFLKQALSKEVINIFEDGMSVRDFVDVRDVSRFLVIASQDLSEEPVSYYDVGSGRGVTILEIVDQIRRQIRGTEAVITGQYRVGDVRRACADVENLHGKSWRPKISLEQSLADIIESMKYNNV